MSRKDYILIAAALHAALKDHNPEINEGVRRSAEQIAHALERANPKFNVDRFMAAVGVK